MFSRGATGQKSFFCFRAGLSQNRMYTLYMTYDRKLVIFLPNIPYTLYGIRRMYGSGQPCLGATALTPLHQVKINSSSNWACAQIHVSCSVCRLAGLNFPWERTYKFASHLNHLVTWSPEFNPIFLQLSITLRELQNAKHPWTCGSERLSWKT